MLHFNFTLIEIICTILELLFRSLNGTAWALMDLYLFYLMYETIKFKLCSNRLTLIATYKLNHAEIKVFT